MGASARIWPFQSSAGTDTLYQWVFRTLLLITLGLILWRGLGPYILLDYVHNMDKLAHGAAFFAMAACLDLGFDWRKRVKISLILGFGLLLELAQMLTPRHGPSVYDWLSDALGVASYFALARLGQHLWRCWQRRQA